jgi:putative two-component system response regulator
MSKSNDKNLMSAPPQKVLVIDDESDVRRCFTRWLTAAGYECAEARDATEAWESLRQQSVHLITLDVRMPGESGADLVHQIKREYPDTAILMVTGVDVAVQAVQSLSRGAFGYLIKPVDSESLLFHVRTGLAQRQRQIASREHLRRLEQCASDRQEIASDCTYKTSGQLRAGSSMWEV